jgi:hypothetical protein
MVSKEVLSHVRCLEYAEYVIQAELESQEQASIVVEGLAEPSGESLEILP